MTIGIIGAGSIGQAIAKRLGSAGIPASISNNHGPRSLSSIVQGIGSGITAVELKVAAKADVVFLAVPWSVHTEAVAGLAPWDNRIVIDAMNAASVGPEGFRPFDLGGRPSSQVVADRLTGARVVKAFNTLPASILASDPQANGGQRMLFVSGDDESAKQEVTQLIGRLRIRGHRPRKPRVGAATAGIPGWAARRNQCGSVSMMARQPRERTTRSILVK
jgi:8-hydroxy-5-deazaflavin:NADPH oxidoreductase